MANEAEQAIYQRLASAPLFHPASVELLPEDWGIETGDVVSVKSGTETYNVPVYSHTLVWNGKSKATIESTGHEQREPLPELRRKEYQQGHATYTGFKANKQEINDHWQHVTQVTDKGMSDSFGIIGVKIGADGMPMKDASGNYIWDDTGSGGEIWGHLNRTAWTTQIVNHIKDANGKIISLGEVTTDAYGNVIINAINDQRTGTATINANRVNINGNVKISDVLDISNGALWVKRMALFGPYGGTKEQYISINNGTLQAPTVQVNSGGTFKIVGSSGNYKALTYTDFLRFVTGFDAAQEINGEIIIPYHTVQSGQSTAADTINFNIAATQYYIDGVAAARAQGRQDHTASSIRGITIYAADAGQVVTKYPYVTYSNGDASSSLAMTVDCTAVSGGGTHNITIGADERFDSKPSWAVEIFEDTGDYEDLRTKKTGYYTFKVKCNGESEKWYCFHVGDN